MSGKSQYKAKARGVNLIKHVQGHIPPQNQNKKNFSIKKMRPSIFFSIATLFSWILSTGFIRFTQLDWQRIEKEPKVLWRSGLRKSSKKMKVCRRRKRFRLTEVLSKRKSLETMTLQQCFKLYTVSLLCFHLVMCHWLFCQSPVRMSDGVMGRGPSCQNPLLTQWERSPCWDQTPEPRVKDYEFIKAPHK